MSVKSVAYNVQKISEILINNDLLSDLSTQSIFRIYQVFGLLKIKPHEELIYRLEPYLIKHIEQYTPIELGYMFTYVWNMQVNSQTIFKALLVYTRDNAEKLPAKLLIECMRHCDSKLIREDVYENDDDEVDDAIEQFVKYTMHKLDKFNHRDLINFLDMLEKLGHSQKVSSICIT